MKILFVSQERRYERIVRELRKHSEIDYVFRSAKFKIDQNDYHLPGIFGYHYGFVLLTYLVISYLLLTKRYDVCLVDYKSVYRTLFFPVLRKYTKFIKTDFIFDLRTIPVDYHDDESAIVEKRFCRSLKFANLFYQGITVITDEMKRYLEQKYFTIKTPIGIWQTGVEVDKFLPLPKNLDLRNKIGFRDDDFVCFYHGSLGLKRGVVELAEAFTILAPKYGKIKLFILGSGKCYEKVREIIEKNKLDANVKLHGWVAGDMVPQFISMADLCVIPLADIDWWRVSSPFKLMEYIACGKNILLSRMAAHVNVVGRDCGYFWIDRITAESMAERIEESYRQYMADPARYRENGLRERERLVNEISWGCRAQSLSGFFTTVVSEV